jgi:hypothetical protein
MDETRAELEEAGVLLPKHYSHRHAESCPLLREISMEVAVKYITYNTIHLPSHSLPALWFYCDSHHN